MTIVEILTDNPAFIQRHDWSSPVQVASVMMFAVEDLLANDWEVPETEAVVKRSTLKEVFNKQIAPSLNPKTDLDAAFNEICKAVGVDAQ